MSNHELLALAALPALLGCHGAAAVEHAASAELGRTDPAGPAGAAAHMAAIAADFGSWAPVESGRRRTPTDCGLANLGVELGAQVHQLSARDCSAYLGLESGASQRDQVVVKQVFATESWTMPGPGSVPPGVERLDDGSYVKRGAAIGLLVMANDGRGHGEASWTYGVVGGDGHVVDAGRIASCSACHRAAPFDGLFGLAWRAPRTE